MIHKETLVTGGAGFIGSHLSQLSIVNGHEVGVIDYFTSEEEGYA